MSSPERLVSQTLAAPAITVPVHLSDSRRAATGVRAWLLTGFLFLLPVLAYWPATFHDYGLRDDYSNLRESHEELGKVLQFCASHARPIYGWLLQSSYGATTSVHNLGWMRLLASVLLGSLSLVMFRGLRALGWTSSAALCVAILIGLVPASQVIAGWAVGWPYAATALVALRRMLQRRKRHGESLGEPVGRRAGQWALATALMVASALTYQPSALFYVVPVAAALIAQRERGLKETARWLGAHIAFVFVSLGLAYSIMSVLYASGVFVKSGRVAFEHHWGDKIGWFLSEALPNALSLFVINDNNHRDRALYLGCAGLVGLILAAGACIEWRRHGRARGIIWTAGLVGLPAFAFLVSLVASERYATYRRCLR